MSNNKRKRGSHESFLEDKNKIKRSTTLFPADSFGVPPSQNSFKLIMKEEDIETEKEQSTSDCEVLNVIQVENKCLTDTDANEDELKINPECLSNECLASTSYLSTNKKLPINNNVCFYNKDVVFPESNDSEKAFSPKRKIFSLETAKYLQIKRQLTIDDISTSLLYLRMTLQSTNHLCLSPSKSEVMDYSNLEQDASSSSKFITQNIPIKSLQHAEQLFHNKSIAGSYTNACKTISPNNVLVGDVSTLKKTDSEICVAKRSTIKSVHKDLYHEILTSKKVTPTSFLSKPVKSASLISEADCSKQNLPVIDKNKEAESFRNKRKPEEKLEKPLLRSKKIKKQHRSRELFNNPIPTSIENTQIQPRNQHSPQICESQMSDIRDPRLRKNVISGTNGTNGYQMHSHLIPPNTMKISLNAREQNQDFTPAQQEMPYCILDWEPNWLKIKNDDYPPILGDFRPPHVKDIYTTKEEYSKTYCSIHLLSIWQAIQYSFKSQMAPKTYKCNVQNVEEVRSYFKNECLAFMPFNEMLKYSSIILIRCDLNGQLIKMFGYVYEIKAMAAHRSSQDSNNSSSEEREIYKFKFFCYTTKKIENYKKTHVIIQKLCRVRVQMKQYEALCLHENSNLTDCIINPLINVDKIKSVILPSVGWKEHINKFVTEWQSKIAFTIIKNLNNNETLIILTLVSKLMTHSTIFICMRDREKFIKIANHLKDRCVLAVKESEVSVPRDLQQHTIRSKAKELCIKERTMSHEKAELEVLKLSKIIVTLISDMYFSDTTVPIFGPNLICIIDDAHKCTEADTSLPLSFNPSNVFLLGDSSHYPYLDPRQQKLSYQKTLFHRLSQYAM